MFKIIIRYPHILLLISKLGFNTKDRTQLSLASVSFVLTIKRGHLMQSIFQQIELYRGNLGFTDIDCTIYISNILREITLIGC